MNSIQLVRFALFALAASMLASHLVQAEAGGDYYKYLFDAQDEDDHIIPPTLDQLNEGLRSGYAQMSPNEASDLNELMDEITRADGKPGIIVFPVPDKSIFLASIKMMEKGEGVKELDAADLMDLNGRKFNIEFNRHVTSHCLRAERQFEGIKRWIGPEADESPLEPANQILVNKLRICWQLLDGDYQQKVYDYFKFENSWVGKKARKIHALIHHKASS